MNKIIIGLLIGLLMLVAACSSQPTVNTDDIIGGGSDVTGIDDAIEAEEPNDEEAQTDDETLAKEDAADEVEVTAETVVVEMIARQWEFEPREIRLKQGDNVELHIESIDVTHGMLIPDFGVNLRFNPGQDVHADFVADKKGTFPFYCSVPCGRGHSGMVGQIIVE